MTMTLPRRWQIWVVATLAIAALAPLVLFLVAGQFNLENLLSVAGSLPMGFVGLNERWSEMTQWFFYWHPMWVSLVAVSLAYGLHAGLFFLARRKGLLPFVFLEALLILNGVGLFRMCLLHGLK